MKELEEAVDSYIEFIDNEDYNEDRAGDYENDIFEKAVKAFKGKDIFDWINAKIDEHDGQ